MAYNGWDLAIWRDGSVRLTFWDALHGNDIVLELAEDNRAFLCEEDLETDDSEIKKEVNLIEFLRKIAKERGTDGNG